MKWLLGAVLFFVFAPINASAADIEELKRQISILSTQLAEMNRSSKTVPQTCPLISRNVSRGLRGEDVRQLQLFLIGERMLSPDSASGFFGPVTESAVKKFQCPFLGICAGSPSSNGYGAVGRLTRAKISEICTQKKEDVVANPTPSLSANSGSSYIQISSTPPVPPPVVVKPQQDIVVHPDPQPEVKIFPVPPASALPPRAQISFIDAPGDCNALKARFEYEGKFIAFEGVTVCDEILSVGGVAAFVDTVYRQMQTNERTWRFLSDSTGEYALQNSSGDCRGALYDFRDEFLNISYSVPVDAPCQNIDASIAAATGRNVVRYLLREGIKPISKEATFLNKMCDITVGPNDYLAKIKNLSRTSKDWRVVCMTPGTYSTPLSLTGYSDIYFKGDGWSSTRLAANVTIDPAPGGVTGVFEIISGSNIVLEDAHVENLHSWDLAAVTADISKSASRAIVFSYGKGHTIRRVIAKSGANSTVMFNYDILGQMFGGIVLGTYAAISANGTAFIMDGGQLYLNLPGGDTHPATTGFNSDVYLRKVGVNQNTGHALIGIIQRPEHDVVRMYDIYPEGAGFDSFAVRQPRPSGLRLYVYGSYAPTVKDFWDYDPAWIPIDDGIVTRM
jgi:peptidoglycan hydrolase-like protein with peptidoglycan-binding domain